MVACLVAACGRRDVPSQVDAEGRAVDSEAERGILIDAGSLAALGNEPGLTILHVARKEEEFERARIPGARFLPLDAIVTERDGLPNELPSMAVLDSVFQSVGVTDGGRIVLYGEPLAAARAFFTLDVMGHGGHTAILDGGTGAWRSGGQPLASGPPDQEKSSEAVLEVRDQTGTMVDAAWILARAGDSSIAVIDARPPAEFSGETPGEGVSRPGHIPGARNLFWKETIVSDSVPELRDEATLRRLLLEAGAAPGDTVVAYCRTGVQASHLYVVARHMGYEVRMYDGSFLDWSRRPELPVARGGSRPD